VGIYGFYLWNLEDRRNRDEIQFNESRWLMTTWVVVVSAFVCNLILLGLIAHYPVVWEILPLVIPSLVLSHVANFGIIRKFWWSWLVLIVINIYGLIGTFYFSYTSHSLWTWQTSLSCARQVIQASMGMYGLLAWRKQESRAKLEDS
jgi:nicotinamide riboside transporter PnuC